MAAAVTAGRGGLAGLWLLSLGRDEMRCDCTVSPEVSAKAHSWHLSKLEKMAIFRRPLVMAHSAVRRESLHRLQMPLWGLGCRALDLSLDTIVTEG